MLRSPRSNGLALLAAAILPFLALPSALDAQVRGEATELTGKCAYADRYAKLLERNHVFAICDGVVIDRTGVGSTIDFRSDDRGSEFFFSGEFTGAEMRVESLRVRQREAIAVKGDCWIFTRDERISVVTCVVTDRRRTYAANFESEA